jgi:hypothetical protein
MNGVEPTSKTDALAMLHDIEYLEDGEKFSSDYKAASSAPYTLQGQLMNIGLKARMIADVYAHQYGTKVHFNGRTDKNDISTYDLQQELLQRAKPFLEKYNIPARLN